MLLCQQFYWINTLPDQGEVLNKLVNHSVLAPSIQQLTGPWLMEHSTEHLASDVMPMLLWSTDILSQSLKMPTQNFLPPQSGPTSLISTTKTISTLVKIRNKGLFTYYIIIFRRVLDHIHSKSYYHHFLAYHICPHSWWCNKWTTYKRKFNL